MSYADVRHWYEDKPDPWDLYQADKAKAQATHREHECHDEGCRICEGGLFLCTVCGGADGTLPYECPGVRMTEEQEADVMAFRKDFIAGEWRVPLVQTPACDKCSVGVMDRRNPHRVGGCYCPCHNTVNVQ